MKCSEQFGERWHILLIALYGLFFCLSLNFPNHGCNGKKKKCFKLKFYNQGRGWEESSAKYLADLKPSFGADVLPETPVSRVLGYRNNNNWKGGEMVHSVPGRIK